MSKPLRGRAAAEAAAKAQDLAKVALAQRDAREGAGDLPSLAAPVMATPLAPAAPPLAPATAPLAPLAAPAAAQAPVELPLQTPGSAVQLQEAAQLRGGPVPMVPWYSGIGGDAPVLAKAEVEKVRKLRDEFEGASAEYRVLSQVAVAGMTSKEGKSLQKRFKELEQAWGAFQWNQKNRSLNPTTREEVQAASAALAAQPKGVDLEHEVETVLAELWDSLEKPVKPRRAELSDPQLDEELDRLEAYIEARIHEEEKAEREGREAKSRPKLEVCATQSEVLGDMSAKFQQSHPMGLDEGTGGTPMTSYTAQEEVHVLPGSGAWFDREVQHLSKEVHSVSDKLNKEMVSRRPVRPAGSAYLGDLAGGSGPSLHHGENPWGNVFTPARTPFEARARPIPVRSGARNGY